MKFLWDTNVLVNYVRDDERYQKLNSKYDFFSTKSAVISIISLGEIYSFAIQNKWGKKKLERLDSLLHNTRTIPIFNAKIIKSYANIDAYSQNKLPQQPLPKGLSARNMGKNDIWIAATAHTHNLTLLTSDKDFLHLDKVFIDVIKY